MTGFSVLHVQESKRLVALTLNLISVQPCAGRENEKREKVEIIYFREINVPGTIPVIQYLPHTGADPALNLTGAKNENMH